MDAQPLDSLPSNASLSAAEVSGGAARFYTPGAAHTRSPGQSTPGGTARLNPLFVDRPFPERRVEFSSPVVDRVPTTPMSAIHGDHAVPDSAAQQRAFETDAHRVHEELEDYLEVEDGLADYFFQQPARIAGPQPFAHQAENPFYRPRCASDHPELFNLATNPLGQDIVRNSSKGHQAEAQVEYAALSYLYDCQYFLQAQGGAGLSRADVARVIACLSGVSALLHKRLTVVHKFATDQKVAAALETARLGVVDPGVPYDPELTATLKKISQLELAATVRKVANDRAGANRTQQLPAPARAREPQRPQRFLRGNPPRQPRDQSRGRSREGRARTRSDERRQSRPPPENRGPPRQGGRDNERSASRHGPGRVAGGRPRAPRQ